MRPMGVVAMSFVYQRIEIKSVGELTIDCSKCRAAQPLA